MTVLQADLAAAEFPVTLVNRLDRLRGLLWRSEESKV